MSESLIYVMSDMRDGVGGIDMVAGVGCVI